MFKIIYRAIRLLKNKKKIVYFITSANILFAILILIEPIIYWKIIDILVGFSNNGTSSLSSIYEVIIFWMVIWLSIIISRLFVSLVVDRMAHRQFHENCKRFFSHILNLSYRFHTNSNSWKLVKKITKWVDSLFMVNLDFFRRILPDIFTILILVPLILFLNLELWLFVVLLWWISSFIAFYSVSKVFAKQNKIEENYTNMSSLYWDTFSNISIVKSFTLKKQKIDELKRLSDETLKKQFPILYLWGFLVSFSQIIKIIISIWIIVFWSYLFFEWEITVWWIVMFLSFATLLLSSIERLMWSLESMFWRISSIKDYFKILDTEIEIQDLENAKKLKNIKWEIEFKDLTFSYDWKRDVLKNINIKIRAWERIAFVWHTWSWKTTMTNMLFRFFEPQKWKILIDGINIRKVTQDSLRKNIWAVFQESSMFNTSILNNIKLDNKKATKKDIVEVAKKSFSYDFIKSLSDSFDTIVWERWVKLSGWEKQRLSIARAFLKDAPILVLDEATSALDAETEKHLQTSLDKLMKWRTTFIIAHRLSTIRKVDKIFVFNNWKIVESGSYKELKEKGWYFTKLVNSQIEGFVG